MFDSRRATALTIVLIVGSCGLTGAMIGWYLSPQSSPQSDDPYSVEVVVPPRHFGEYVEYETNYELSAPQYDLESDLSNVINLAQFQQMGEWSDDVATQLAERYFVAVPQTEYKQFSELYIDNYWDEIPSFVTVDSVLHVYHVIYDYALRGVEEENLSRCLDTLLGHMVEVSLDQHDELEDSWWKECALKNTAFFCVSAKLLNPDFEIPDSVLDWVNQVLDLMEQGQGFSTYWFMGQREDFSQYNPRGHYTRTEALKRFFKAMMWIGRINFRLHPSDPWLTREERTQRGKNETAQAILLCLGLKGTSPLLPQQDSALELWRLLYDPTAFFVGACDDLTPHEYLAVIDIVYGQDDELASLPDEALMDTFIEAVDQCRNPAILSDWMIDSAVMENATKGLAFMGQRYVPDSYMLWQLVHPNVDSRFMPKGLDVMSVLGSERAWELLDDQKHYPDFVEQMEMLRESFDSLNQETWTQNLYWLWLYCFKPLLHMPAEGHPSFMMDAAWTDKQLLTSLSTWTELRHDTILYAKQSYTGWLCAVNPPPGYVEPVPEVYARLASLCKLMTSGLNSRDLLNQETEEKLDTLHFLLRALQRISEKELSSVPLNETEIQIIENVGYMLRNIETLEDDIDRSALAVDIHTDSNSLTVLEQATGNPMILIVAVPNEEGEPYLAKGAMYSYYEFTQPMSERLTDEAWWDILDCGQEPSMPPWVHSFVANDSVPTGVVEVSLQASEVLSFPVLSKSQKRPRGAASLKNLRAN